MAEIMEKIAQVLIEQAMPAARRLGVLATEVMVLLRERIEEIIRETGEPRPLGRRANKTADRAENYMQGPVPTAAGDQTVEDVRQRLCSQPGAFDAVELLFVTDGSHKLRGVVPLSKLLAASPRTLINELVNGDIASVALTDPPERVAEVALAHRVPAVPVADGEGILLGAVPAHTVFKILREEHIEDMDRMVGIWSSSEQALSAIEGEPLRRVIARLPWLMVGTVGCMLATGLMAAFEATLRADVAVAFFIPAIVYLADAIGTQSEAIAVRGLSFSGTPITELLKGELKTGFYLGLALAASVFPVIWIAYNATLAFAVSVALVFASSVATGIGLLLPSILSRLGKDPAYGSGPVATIIQDVLSLLIYLSLVSVLIL
ncbi:magnesium transporter [Methylococcus sp. EFPC2]|uniref:magnesium transporter n=1 Tax=Methylococcus sp. EFPC2 TaxID=2812648 RepID=UPI001967EFAA|nr:magnesium transporter [Methylococcus sp. EFPC2]QSA96184.1 magnesium transporter [Methylococcus sp. EFPC2]